MATSVRDRVPVDGDPAPEGRTASVRRDRIGRWPAGLIGALGLILAFEGIIAQMPAGGGRRSRLDSSWQSALQAAEGPEAGSEILCFGDSLIKLGILPRILQARIGRSAYNLAVLGGQPPTTHCLLRRVLERGQTPRALIVHFSPLLLGMDPSVNLEWWAGELRGQEHIDAILRAGEPGIVLLLILHQTIASLSRRDESRSALGFDAFEPAREERQAGGYEVKALVRNWAINRGAQIAPRLFVPIRGSLPGPYTGSGWRWRPYPLHAYFVERFLGLAQERGIPVYWVIPPAEAGWLERNEGVGTIGAYREYVRGLLARFPVLTVLDLQRAGWDRSLFRDLIHLNRDGAVRLSLAVADAIAREAGAANRDGRWLTMDGGGIVPPRPYQDMLEDLDQSRLAVSQGESGPITMEGPSR